MIVTEPGTYTLMITDNQLGCVYADSLVVETTTPLVTDLQVISTDESCVAAGQLLLPTFSELSSLSINGEAVPLQDSYELPAATYLLTAQDLNGCPLDTLVTVAAAGLVTIDLGPDLTVEQGSVINLDNETTGPVTSYIWSASSALACADCPDNQLTASVTDTIMVTVSSDEGCQDSDTLVLAVIETEIVTDLEPFYIPNIFQPGLAGNEALVLGLDTEQVESYVFRVYDRWGSLVAEREELVTTSSVVIWDGTKDGEPLNSGVYVYMAEFLYVNSIEAVVSGTITLLR